MNGISLIIRNRIMRYQNHILKWISHHNPIQLNNTHVEDKVWKNTLNSTPHTR